MVTKKLSLISQSIQRPAQNVNLWLKRMADAITWLAKSAKPNFVGCVCRNGRVTNRVTHINSTKPTRPRPAFTHLVGKYNRNNYSYPFRYRCHRWKEYHALLFEDWERQLWSRGVEKDGDEHHTRRISINAINLFSDSNIITNVTWLTKSQSHSKNKRPLQMPTTR